jgi:hypothetical protein
VRWLALIGALVAFGLAGCGGDESLAQPQPITEPTPTAATATAPTTAAEPKPDVNAAEDAARDALPHLPVWKGTKFNGRVTNHSKVCVDRRFTKDSASVVGGERRSHVSVSWPDLKVGKPQSGPCAKAEEVDVRQAEAARRFYLAMDNLAVQLDEAILAAQDDKPGTADRLSALHGRIYDQLNQYLLANTSVGGNLVASAATAASNAARDGDVAEMTRQRREVAEARNRLADEATGR